jgi:hypothetical protein
MTTNTFCCRVTYDSTFTLAFSSVLADFCVTFSSNSSHHNPDAPCTELQLKPHHLPFKVMKKWQEILESFAIGDTYDGKCGHLCLHAMVIDQTSEVFFLLASFAVMAMLIFVIACAFSHVLAPLPHRGPRAVLETRRVSASGH